MRGDEGGGWFAAFHVTHALEFLCLTAAQLMVLDRMSMFVSPEGSAMRVSRRRGEMQAKRGAFYNVSA
jgi:hypothetical protein